MASMELRSSVQQLMYNICIIFRIVIAVTLRIHKLVQWPFVERLYLAIKCPGMYRYVQVCTGMYRYVQVCTGMYRYRNQCDTAHRVTDCHLDTVRTDGVIPTRVLDAGSTLCTRVLGYWVPAWPRYGFCIAAGPMSTATLQQPRLTVNSSPVD